MGGGKSNYRSDIDGLRAIACLSVVIYHAFPTVLIGGFTGVDIFFVISGFLISSILFRELANPQNPGKINIIDFYIRRIRRIFPALIVVLITCLTLGYFVLFPDEYALLGKHTAGGAVYINNILLYKESGNYFDVAANAKPLLHLWSLGVEEQFYLIFPLILWAIYRFNINFVFGLTVFTVISFICNKNAINHSNQTAAFFLPQFRFWELSIGAILAYIVEYHKVFVDKFKQFTKEILIKKICLRNSNIAIKDSTLNNILSIIGLLLIIIGILTVKQNLKFPGSKALIPVFGALFIIAAGKESFINQKILSNKVMVFLGLISYPLYLWHWPLLSFANICENFQPKAWLKIIAIVSAFILSVLTYLFIEPSFRYGKRKIFSVIVLLISIYFLGIVGYFIFSSEKLKQENRNSVNEAFSRELINRENICNSVFNDWNTSSDNPDYWHFVTSCKMKSKEDKIALIGDSHAGSYYLGIAKKYADKEVSVFPRANAAPFYMVRTGSHHNENFKKNYEYINHALDYICHQNNYKIVILSHTPLASYFDTEYMGNDITIPYSKDNSFATLKIAIKNTVDTLLASGKKVIFTLDNPKLPNKHTNCIYRPITINYTPKCEFDKEFYMNTVEIQEYNKFIKSLIKTDYPNENVDFVDFAEILCDDKKCYEGINNKPLYQDQNHLNQEGSNLVAPKLIQKISKWSE